ncbi:MAG: hypothetical protein M1828_004905 [Chrysothrix sp. TS-e1954]|nr:MAG: hypothetical protein M1828_004905 [Chrysothrix sp. TS-e1954]
MGNTNSAEQQNEVKDRDRDSQSARAPRRRESIQVLPQTRQTAAPPSASLEKAQGSTISRSSTRASDHSPSQPRSGSNHARKRSQTSATPVSRLQESAHAEETDLSTANTRLSPEQNDPHLRSISPSQPVKVAPQVQAPRDPNLQAATLEPHKEYGTSSHSYMAPNSHFARPPRLPLPIERNELSPGSPIMVPADFARAIERRSSDFSTNSAEEEEIDNEYFEEPLSDHIVDTVIEWKHPADRVYVTGSFSGWTKKHKLDKNGPSRTPNAFSTIVPLHVGTHHLTFLVDGQMRTTNAMPTAVDYTNALVNYVVVSPDDALRSDHDSATESRQAKTAPSTHDLPSRPHPDDQPEQVRTKPPPTPELRPTMNSTAPSAGPSGISSPAVVAQPKPVPSAHTVGSAAQSQTHLAMRKHPERTYHTEIPRFLLDLDSPEESLRHHRAAAVMDTHPDPPTLPMFLSKSILNLNLPMKDDSSVLHMPNHTVLNHLTTSSIKHNVLGTSVTTRYRNKYVTTIMYRPTNTDRA